MLSDIHRSCKARRLLDPGQELYAPPAGPGVAVETGGAGSAQAPRRGSAMVAAALTRN
jgi:hypothetical protein